MSATIETHKYIKSKLSENTSSYDKDQLCLIIQKISTDIDNNKKKRIDVTKFVSKYLHSSNDTDEYYFNIEKKQLTKQQNINYTMITDHSTKINTIKNTQVKYNKQPQWSFTDDKSIDSIQQNSIVSDSSSEILTVDNNAVDLDDLEAEFTSELQCTQDVVSSYLFPTELSFSPSLHLFQQNGPFGTQWIHEVQCDDKVNEILKSRALQYDKLRAVVLPEQRSKEWFEMREGKITASDGGCVLGQNPYEQQYKFIIKKVIGAEFTSNVFCYHGKKYEEIATMIYRYRMNVMVDEFGLMGHTKYSFLGASPDGICNRYKLDGKHLSQFVGRMLEIKCPYVRKIKTSGEIKDNICPLYYWIQVQLQLECCDLEECDFWQCKIEEYSSYNEFLQDTHEEDPFRSKSFEFEKGIVLQLLPHGIEINSSNYLNIVYDKATFIYPPKIEMSPYDVSLWLSDTISNLKNTHKLYYLDRVIYWRLEQSHNVTVMRDREWFKESLPVLQKMWNYVLFFRKNPEKMEVLSKYINTRTKKVNTDIMNVANKLYTLNDDEYKKYTHSLLKTIVVKEKEKEKTSEKIKGFDTQSCLFVDD